jgi:hypothetical protein
VSRIEIMPRQRPRELERMENVILQYYRAEQVGPAPIRGNIAELLTKETTDKWKQSSMMDLLWIVLRQQPTDDLFAVDNRAAQTIPGKCSYVVFYMVVLIRMCIVFKILITLNYFILKLFLHSRLECI